MELNTPQWMSPLNSMRRRNSKNCYLLDIVVIPVRYSPSPQQTRQQQNKGEDTGDAWLQEKRGVCIWPLNKAMRRIIFIIQIFMLWNSIGLSWRLPFRQALLPVFATFHPSPVCSCVSINERLPPLSHPLHEPTEVRDRTWRVWGEDRT